VCTTCAASFSLLSTKLCGCATTTYLSAVNNTCVTIYPPPIGYYNDGQNNMIACGLNCATCTSAAVGSCKSCLTSFTLTNGACACAPKTTYLSAVNNTCVNLITCPVGKWNDGFNVCGTCATNCTACIGAANNCTTCKSTFSLNYPV